MRIQSPTRFPSECAPAQGSSLGRGGQMLLVPISEMRLDGLAPQGRHFPSSNVHTPVLIRHLVTTQSSTHEVLGRGGRPETVHAQCGRGRFSLEAQRTNEKTIDLCNTLLISLCAGTSGWSSPLTHSQPLVCAPKTGLDIPAW